MSGHAASNWADRLGLPAPNGRRTRCEPMGPGGPCLAVSMLAAYSTPSPWPRPIGRVAPAGLPSAPLVGTPSRALAWPARNTGANSDEVKVNENRNRLGRTTPHWLVLLAAIPLIVSIAAPLLLTSAQET